MHVYKEINLHIDKYYVNIYIPSFWVVDNKRKSFKYLFYASTYAIFVYILNSFFIIFCFAHYSLRLIIKKN